MKILHFWGLTVLTVLLSFNLVSCDKNDDNGISNLEELEGEWILISNKYSFTESGELVEDEDIYDFETPQYGSEKMIIQKTDQKDIYRIQMFEYHKDWYEYDNSEIELDGKKIVYLGDDDGFGSATIEISSLKNDKLIITGKTGFGEYKSTFEKTYQKRI